MVASSLAPIRVLYTNWVCGGDGAATHVREVSRELEALGCQVSLFWHRGAPGTHASGRGTVRKRRTLGWLLHEPKEFLQSIPGFFGELRAARRFRPDLILCRYSPGKWCSALLSRVLRLPLVTEVNALYEEENVAYFSEYLHYRPLMRWAERALIRRSVGVMVVSRPLRDSIERMFRTPASRILVNPNGAIMRPPLPARTKSEKRSGLGLDDGPLVVFVGSFQRFHGIDLLASVIEQMLEGATPANFLIVGDGDDRPRLEAVRRRFPGKVRLTGHLPEEEVRGLLGICDIGVLPDSAPYCSPLKVVEYMAAGLGIVAPDYPPVRELVENGEAGLLFPPRSEPELLNRMQRLVAHGDLRARLGQAARKAVSEKLLWRHNAERLLAFARQSARVGA